MRKDLTSKERLAIIMETGEATKALAASNDIVNFLYDHAFHITFNANDLFGWGCADAVDVSIQDLPKMLEVYKLFGSEGVDAFLALVDDCNVQEPCNTESYKAAREYLKDYRPCTWAN